jgi:uncharacterized repeat protein (TIGR01451 family)
MNSVAWIRDLALGEPRPTGRRSNSENGESEHRFRMFLSDKKRRRCCRRPVNMRRNLPLLFHANPSREGSFLGGRAGLSLLLCLTVLLFLSEPRQAVGQAALTASIVGDLRQGPMGSDPQDLVNIEGVLYFTADNGTDGRELWKSDPRTGETKMVMDLNPGAASSSPSGLINFQGRLFFTATTSTFGRQLWVYNPFDATTNRVVDFRSHKGASSPEQLTPVGPFLFFTADDGTRGRELWFYGRTREGDVVGIVRVDIRPSNLTAVGETLFFTAEDGTAGDKLWTVETTSVPIGGPEARIVPDATPKPEPPLDDLVNFNGTLFFTASDGTILPGRRLWQSDGTAAGTKLVTPNVIVWPDRPRTFVVVDNKLFFPGSLSVNAGAELFVTDGRVTSFVKDIYPGFRSSIPSQLTKVFGVLFFSARDGIFEPPNPENAAGQELWRSDGTMNGTRIVKDIFPGPDSPLDDANANSSSPSGLTDCDGILFFSAVDADSGGDGTLDGNLWMSDGTDAGTVFFTATDAARGRELWKVELPDADGDGLLDKWETDGIDYDMDGTPDLNLPTMGANPRHKDIFVEADFMTGGNHTHNPEFLPDGTLLNSADNPRRRMEIKFGVAPQANVRNPDGQRGIKLHVEVDEIIDEVPEIRFTTRLPAPSVHFQDLKKRFFGLSNYGLAGAKNPVKLGAHRLVFRYAIFGHRYAEDPHASGIAIGPDLFVSLGGTTNDFEEDIRTKTLRDFPGTTFAEEWIDLVAGTFMHELGHTLGLFHGGGRGIPPSMATNRCINYKPNYLSVMNYSFQANERGRALRLPGIPDHTRQRIERVLDYSATNLLTLDETALVEGRGISGPPGRRTRYGVRNPAGIGLSYIGPTDAAIDWNANGTIDASAAGDINFFDAPSPDNPRSPDQTLLGHDDWSNLVYNFRDSFYFKGGTLDEIPEPEQTADQMFGEIPDVTVSADLELTQTSASASVLAGANVTYTIVVTNKGPNAAANVVITDNLPATMSFVSCSATDGGSCDGSGNSRTIGFASLANGASATITLTAAVNNSVAPDTIITNTVFVASNTSDPDSANNSSTVEVVTVLPPRIQSVRLSGQRIQVTSPAIPGYSYRLQYKDSLAEAQWHDVPGPATIDQGTVTLEDAAPLAAMRFYRVSLQSVSP